MTNIFKLFFIFCSVVIYGQWVNIGLASKTVSKLSTNETLGIIYAVADEQLYKTNDFGQNWILKSINNHQIFEVCVDKVTGKVYLGTNNGIYRSDDNGENFLPINNGFPSSPIFPSIKKIIIKNDDIVIGTNAGIYKSSLDSINWTNVNNNLPLGEIKGLDWLNGNFYVALPSGIYKSTLNNNWETMSSLNVNGLAVQGNDLFLVKLGCSDFIYKSSDYGQTWSNISPNYSFCNALTVANKNNELLIGFYYGSAMSSTNNGMNWSSYNITPWTTILNFEKLNNFVLAGTEYYSHIANSGGVYYKFNSSLGLNEVNTANEKIFVYPNPSRNFVYIDNKNNEDEIIRIYNISGQLVNSFNSRDSKIMIDIRNLKEGAYIIKLEGKNGFRVQKFIKN
ncbi:T9SS type A sorting domain-containing protein [Chryseobacterium rhizosphaerae]|nr:T9SS type A sorting domain-containing protein [Chryseobacterium rhizosphaerae]